MKRSKQEGRQSRKCSNRRAVTPDARKPRKVGCLVALTSAVLVLAGGVDVARGQCHANELLMLTASDAKEGDYFGCSASISGDLAVIGAFGNDDAGSEAGAAYVYRFDGTTWIEVTKLTASDPGDGDGFGSSVTIGGRTSSSATMAGRTTGAR